MHLSEWSLAVDYAIGRQVCDVPYPSDTKASHVLAMIVGIRLLANPSFVAKMLMRAASFGPCI
jgi:hypothetical protein